MSSEADPLDEQMSPVVMPPQRWRCCTCGGTGSDSLNDICADCDGLGFC